MNFFSRFFNKDLNRAKTHCLYCNEKLESARCYQSSDHKFVRYIHTFNLSGWLDLTIYVGIKEYYFTFFINDLTWGHHNHQSFGIYKSKDCVKIFKNIDLLKKYIQAITLLQ